MAGDSGVKLWRYYVKGEGSWHCGWAIFVIGSDGYFSSISDYGNYAFFWGDHGCKDFREFICRAAKDSDYFIRKLAHASHQWIYLGKDTLESIKREICRSRLEGGRRGSKKFTKEWAQKEWDLMKDWECEIEDHQIGFHNWWQRTSLEEAHEFSCYGPSAQVVAFVEKAMAALVPMLEADLNQAKEAAND